MNNILNFILLRIFTLGEIIIFIVNIKYGEDMEPILFSFLQFAFVTCAVLVAILGIEFI